jgi:Tol biopolymer transport system component
MLVPWMAQALSTEPVVAFQLQDDSTVSSPLVEMDINRNLRSTVYNDRIGGDRYPAWSPDGQWLAFTVNDGGVSHIYVIDEGGHDVHLLSDLPVARDEFSWSPDSHRIAFVSLENHNRNIYLVDVEQGVPSSVANVDGDESRPAFSPDGRWLAFQSINPYGSLFLASLFIIKADGTDPHPLTETPVSSTGYAWSPDGQQIAFSSFVTGQGDIYVSDADGSHVRQVTTNQSFDHSPVWSPDGRQIAFWSSEYSVVYACVINTDGSELRQITEARQPEKNDEMSLAWSPDGRQILAAIHSLDQPGLYLAQADGSTSRYLLKNVSNHANPAWRP